jgi:hypothetical protein
MNNEELSLKKNLLGFFLIVLCLECLFTSNEIKQYFVVKEGKKIIPVAEVIYKVFVDKKEVVYWIEIPRQERSHLYKLQKCIVVDINNWEGEPEYTSWVLPDKVEYVNGKFKNSDDVSWWTYHITARPPPNKTARIIDNVGSVITGIFGLAIIMGITAAIYEWIRKISDKKQQGQ